MKLGIISQGFPPDKYSGGIGRYYSELINELNKKIEIHVFTGIKKENKKNDFTENKKQNKENVFFHSVKLEKKFLFPFHNYFNLINYSRNFFDELNKLKKEIDLVECPLGTLNGYYYSKHKFAPLITSIQTPMSEGLTKKKLFLDKKLVFGLEKKIIKNSDALIAATNYSKESIIKKYFGSNHSNINLINQGINTEKFIPIKINPFNETTLLFTGRIEPRKGLHVLIKAFPLIKQKTKIIVSGEKLNPENAYHNQIKNLIEKNSVNIEFLGFQEEKKLIELYNKADFIIEPSFSESACYVLIEAMSCSKTVIASSAGGMKEIALNALQFKTGDSFGLAEKINYFNENEKEKKQLGKKSRQKIIKEYNIKNSAKKYLKLYSSFV